MNSVNTNYFLIILSRKNMFCVREERRFRQCFEDSSWSRLKDFSVEML